MLEFLKFYVKMAFFIVKRLICLGKSPRIMDSGFRCAHSGM